MTRNTGNAVLALLSILAIVLSGGVADAFFAGPNVAVGGVGVGGSLEETPSDVPNATVTPSTTPGGNETTTGVGETPSTVGPNGTTSTPGSGETTSTPSPGETTSTPGPGETTTDLSPTTDSPEDTDRPEETTRDVEGTSVSPGTTADTTGGDDGTSTAGLTTAATTPTGPDDRTATAGGGTRDSGAGGPGTTDGAGGSGGGSDGDPGISGSTSGTIPRVLGGVAVVAVVVVVVSALTPVARRAGIDVVSRVAAVAFALAEAVMVRLVLAASLVVRGTAVGRRILLGTLAAAYSIVRSVVAAVTGFSLASLLPSRFGDGGEAAAAVREAVSRGGDADLDPSRMDIEETWNWLVEEARVRNPSTRTPGEIARAAIDRGFSRYAVEDLLWAYREVVYGERPPDEERRRTALQAHKRLRGSEPSDRTDSK